MFGYVRPLECELRVREQAAYRGCYCGLCKTLGRRHGLFARLALNYDCAFLAAFLGAIGGNVRYQRGGCVPRCTRARRCIRMTDASLTYAADVNVLLSYHKLADDAQDEKSVLRRLKARVLRFALRRAYRYAAKENAALDQEMRDCLSQLAAYEKARVPCSDEPSDAFGRLLSAVVRYAPTMLRSETQASEWMFYNLGKWIYLIDAWLDRAHDQKAGAYNAFLLAQTTKEHAAWLLELTRAEAEKAFDLIAFQNDAGVIQNVMTLGLSKIARDAFRSESTQETAKESIDEPI